MFPPLFAVVSADAGVASILGANPTRVFPFGSAPEGVALPYATWQTISGAPENYLTGRPDLDTFSLQIDCWGSSVSQVRDAARALRDAIEPHAHIVAWRGESIDPPTGRHRFTFDVDWLVPR